MFGDATNQLDDFKGYLDSQNEKANNGWVAIGVGTAKTVTSLGQALTGFLDAAANLAQVATGVDDQQVRDELAATRGMVTDVIDFAINGDYAAGASRVHAAAVNRTADAFGGDVSAISDVSQAVSMLATLKPGAAPRVARGPTVGKSAKAVGQVVQQAAKSKLVVTAGKTAERAVIAGGNRAANIAKSAATGIRESAKAVINNAMKSGPVGLRRQIGAVGNLGNSPRKYDELLMKHLVSLPKDSYKIIEQVARKNQGFTNDIALKVELTKPIKGVRFSGGGSSAAGPYVAVGQLSKSRKATRELLALMNFGRNSYNSMRNRVDVTLEPGAQFFLGEVAPQASKAGRRYQGGGTQLFVEFWRDVNKGKVNFNDPVKMPRHQLELK